MQSVIENVRYLLQQGETVRAFSVLIQALQERGDQPHILRILRVTEISVSKVRQDELKGLLTPQEAQALYNRANNTLLAAIEGLETGKTVFEEKAPAPRRRFWMAGSVAAGVLLAAVFWYFSNRQADNCPAFSDARPHVLILPFVNLGGSADEVKAAAIIKKRIDDIAEKNKFLLSAKVYTEFTENVESIDRDQALAYRVRCGANMVIWGFYDNRKGQDSLRLDTRFIFGADNQTGGTGFRSFAGLPEVTSAQSLRTLDDVVFSLCSWVAYSAGRDSLAMKWLQKVKQKAPQDIEMMERMNAEYSKIKPFVNEQ